MSDEPMNWIHDPLPEIVPPDVPAELVVTFTDEQLRQIYGRIELIDQHFERCCAFQLDRCRYDGEYNRMYGFLELAGLPPEKGPIDRDAFERWLADRGGKAGGSGAD